MSGRISRVEEEQAGGRVRPGSVAVPKEERAGVPPSRWPGCSPGDGGSPPLSHSWRQRVAPVPVGLKPLPLGAVSSLTVNPPIPALEHFYFPLGNGV